MVIGGWQKSSLIDYPGKVSCVLFLSGCNFDCPYCYNPDLAKGMPAVVLNEGFVLDFLKRRKGFLDGVVISGGEPTLNPELFALCKNIKQMGYPLKLDTNGSRPLVIQRLLDQGLVDYIAMDIKTDPFKYAAFIQKDCDPEQILLSIRTIMKSTTPYEFRTTCIKPLINESIMESIGQHIQGAALYVLQPVKTAEVLHPEFFQNHRCEFDEDELMRLKSVIEPSVMTCMIR
jgi:pyruvate formate lyase activating enzyme